jgi:undecaprenyl-diphosphatase
MNTLLQRVHQWDTWAFLWLHVTRDIGYRRSIRWISHSGDGYCYALIALGLFWLEPTHGQTLFIIGVTAYVLEVGTYLAIKNRVKRQRPAVKLEFYQAWITPSDQFSFPSGHTAAAFLFAYLITHFYPIFALPVYGWALMIGSSRVLLGVHYPSDIAAGAVLGTVCAVGALYAYPMWWPIVGAL